MPGKPSTFTAAELAVALKQGLSHTDIARQYGVAQAVVSQCVRRYGLDTAALHLAWQQATWQRLCRRYAQEPSVR